MLTDQEVGELFRKYREAILIAYAYSETLKRNGIERPWITSPDKVMVGGPSEVTRFEVEINKRLRLEVR